MKVSLYILLLFQSFSCILSAQKVEYKFPLYKIGIKVKKPANYFLLTPDKTSLLRDSLRSMINVCIDDKIVFDSAALNPNYQVLLNDSNFRETYTFVRMPLISVDTTLSSSFQQELNEECSKIKNSSIVYLSSSKGTSRIGNYVSLLNQIITPEFTYYSDIYIFETRNSTIILSINSFVKISNADFINSLEYINSEFYENVLVDYYDLLSKNDFTNASAKLFQSIVKEPENLSAYFRTCTPKLVIKKYNDAIIDADIILKLDATAVSGFMLKGVALFDQENYEDAITNFRAAQALYSFLSLFNAQNEYYISFTTTYRYMGIAYSNISNAAKASEYFELALELSVDSLNTASIYYNLARVQSTLLHNSLSAVNFYPLAINNYPISASKQKSEAYLNSGINKSNLYNFDGAISDYTLAIKIRPDYAKAYSARGYARLKLLDYKAAISDFTFAIKYDNYNTTLTSMALGNRGIAKLNLGIDGCLDLKKAVELGNKNISSLYNESCK
nr:hypothetical protein [Bacteroidota bacterium]